MELAVFVKMSLWETMKVIVSMKRIVHLNNTAIQRKYNDSEAFGRDWSYIIA